MKVHRFCLPVLGALLLISAAATGAEPDPILLGIDTAASYSFYGKVDEATRTKALKELGVNFIVYHIHPNTEPDNKNDKRMAARIAAKDGMMRRHGFKYTLNNEVSNFGASAEIDPGVNEFEHPDGTHRWDFRMKWLRPCLLPDENGPPALVGITYDECVHMQLTSHQFVRPLPGQKKFDAPLLADTTGMDLETAFDRLVTKAKLLRTDHYEGALRLQTEQVWPDMFHVFARAGWTITPKILKEHLSSVVMSISLGAALEYEDSGVDWWVSPDLWCKGRYPGHSPEALRSALMMGYWLGADALYVENFGYRGKSDKLRHPLASPKGSLIAWNDDGTYEWTKHGQVVRDFYTDHVPNHPRKHSWRDYRPRVAIIRLPDGAWGQRGSGYRDRLLGSKDHPMDDISGEWLHVWPILTHGVAREGAISLNNKSIYPEYPWPFFVPIDSVAVFDHLVTGSVLDSVECFIVCGHALSDETFADIARRVEKNPKATCIISRRLYDACPSKAKVAKEHSKGKWVIVDSFNNPAVATAIQPYLGPADVARFRFKDFTIEFHAGADRDAVKLKIVEER